MSNPIAPPKPQERYGKLAFEENEILKKSGHFLFEHDMKRSGLLFDLLRHHGQNLTLYQSIPLTGKLPREDAACLFESYTERLHSFVQ